MRALRSPFVLGGLLVAIAIAVFLSPIASSDPDGLERVSVDEGFDDKAEDHALDDAPLADYGVRGVREGRLGTAVSGLVGVLLTFGIGALLFGLVRRRSDEPAAPDEPVAREAHAEGQPLGA